ncbi:MAG TPA: hypothetical protein VFD07_09560 [Candidatus Krumholzibacteria bacterium]|nr:hypothetical protein [Candidatus Krumholzibacteria bacterium]
MTASQVRRSLALILAAGGLVLSTWPRHAPAKGQESTRFATVSFDSATVTPPSFSPNGDLVFDLVEIFYTLPETTTVDVFVTSAGSSTVLRTLDTRRLPPRERTRVEWRGEDTSGLIQPEGSYTIHFTGTTVTQRVLSNERQVRIDVTPAMPHVLDVAPRRIAPTVPGNASIFPIIRMRVSSSELEDRIGVAILDASGVPRDTLDPEGGFAGDGDYVFLGSNLLDVSFDDGVYQYRAFGLDAAGNDSTVVDSLDKNTEGPHILVTHPPLPRAVQNADSLVGQATDRQIVASIQARVAVGGETTFVTLSPRDAVPSPRFRFLLDTSTLFAAEAVYAIQLHATDEDGVEDSLRLSIRVDRTPPPPPTPRPPLPQVTKSQVLSATVHVDSLDTARIVVSGGAETPDTLFAVNSSVRFNRVLNPGSNQLRFEAIDLARNISLPTVSTVTWETGAGVAAPERFSAGQSIEVNVGGTPAQGVFVRVLAMDGSLVRTFEDLSPKPHYAFTWDLRTPEGQSVRNGAYLVLARVRFTNGSEELYRTMIAVVR